MPVSNTLRKAKRSFNIFAKTTWLHKALYFLAFLICETSNLKLQLAWEV